MTIGLLNSDQQTCSIHTFVIPVNGSHWETSCTVPEIGTITHVMVTPNQNIDEIVLQYDDATFVRYRQTLDSTSLFESIPEFSMERKLRADAYYVHLKQDIKLYSLLYSGMGMTVTSVVLGPPDGVAFGIGSTLAMVYHYMLQKETDRIGQSNKLSVDKTMRLLILSGILIAILDQFSEQIQQHNSYYILGLLGFMSYKMALFRSAYKHE